MLEKYGGGSYKTPEKLPEGSEKSVEASKSKRTSRVQKNDFVQGSKKLVNKAIDTLEGHVERARSGSHCTFIHAKFMSKLVNTVAFKALFPEKATEEVAFETPVPRKSWIKTKPSEVERKSAEIHRTKQLQVELRQIHSVLVECTGSKKKPRLTKEGELVAKEGSDQKSEEAVSQILRTIHEATLLGVAPKGPETSMGDIYKMFADLKPVQTLQNKNESFSKTLLAVQTTVDQHQVVEQTKSMHKGSMIKALLQGTDADLSLLLMRSHRNNPETKNLLADLSKEVKGIQDPALKNKVLTNVLKFGQQYVESGTSIPVGGSDRTKARDDLLELANLGKTSGDKELRQLGASLEEAVKIFVPLPAPIQPRVALEDLVKADTNPEEIVPAKILHAAYEELRRAEHVLGEKADLNANLNAENKAIAEKERKLKGEPANKDELVQQISRHKEKMGQIKVALGGVDRRYPGLAKATDDLKAKLAEIEQRPIFRKFSLDNMSAEEFYKESSQLLDVSFARVSLSEFDELVWSKPVQRHQLAPNLLDHIAMQGALSNLAIQSILASDKPGKATEKVIDAAYSALKNNHFALAMALQAALNDSNVFNLKDAVWGHVSTTHKERMDEIGKKLSIENNFKQLLITHEEALRNGPVNPFLGAYQSQLTFVLEANASTTNRKLNMGGKEVSKTEVNLRRNQLYEASKDQIAMYKDSQKAPTSLGSVGFLSAALNARGDMSKVLNARSDELKKRTTL